MLTINKDNSILLLIDFQEKLLPSISGGREAVANARCLLEAARILSVETLLTEQYPAGLGHTVSELDCTGIPVIEKTTFDATRARDWDAAVPEEKDIIVAGCEAHVCVLQTALDLRHQGRKVWLVTDAIGSRTEQNKKAAITRMRDHGVECVTTEMVLFEWLESKEHPNFKDILPFIK